MLALSEVVIGPWLIVGNFNLIRYPHEKNNSRFDRNLAAAFNGLIRDAGWFELPLSNRRFTWSNLQDVPVLARLDRAFFNDAWNTTFPNSSLSSLPRPVSDHHALAVSAATSIPNPAHFRFENSWLIDPDFLPSTIPSWAPRLPVGDAALDIAASIKRFQTRAKAWKKEHWYVPQFDNNCCFVINLLDFVEELRPLSGDEGDLRRDARDQLASSVCRAAAHWKQRAKVRLLKEGDVNTCYFHAQASQRFR
jgi:hypothetical protein